MTDHPHHPHPGAGWVEVVCGPMFSGKTEEFIRRLRRATLARQKVQVFKPRLDDRYDAADVVSHDDLRVGGVPVEHARDILRLVVDGTAVVGIDEVQFFDEHLVDVVNELADRGIRVICAGLDQDAFGRPFSPVPQLLAVAERVEKLMAVCVVCGAPANRSQRTAYIADRISVGGAEAYEARCRRCHVVPDYHKVFPSP